MGAWISWYNWGFAAGYFVCYVHLITTVCETKGILWSKKPKFLLFIYLLPPIWYVYKLISVSLKVHKRSVVYADSLCSFWLSIRPSVSRETSTFSGSQHTLFPLDLVDKCHNRPLQLTYQYVIVYSFSNFRSCDLKWLTLISHPKIMWSEMRKFTCKLSEEVIFEFVYVLLCCRVKILFNIAFFF